MKLVPVLALVVASVCLVNCFSFRTDKKWNYYKKLHGKVYKSSHDDSSHFATWKKTLKTVEEHNQKFELGQTTY
jgi:hypothetical protein